LPSTYTEMRHLAEKIILHGIEYWPQTGEGEEAVFNRKIAILHIDQGVELILKAYLLRSGYLIHRLKEKKIKQGLKPGASIDDYLDENKTLDFEDARQLCKKLMNECNRQPQTDSHIKLDGLSQLHKKRNEVQHYGVRVSGKTPDLIIGALRDLLTIYEFAEFAAADFSNRVNGFIGTVQNSRFENP